MAEKNKIAMRDAYGKALADLGAVNEKIIVLDADLANATKTSIFRERFPDRHFDCGIAEANMMGIAAGMSTMGKIPFVSSFAMFAAGRAFEQIRNSIAYPFLNVKIAATHAGITVGEDGATHQCNEDIGLMRQIPGMTVIVPSDNTEAAEAVKAAAEYRGPVYLRFSRMAVEDINNRKEYSFQIGKAVTLKDGNDVTIVTAGICTVQALKASEQLEKKGIHTRVINMHTIKPLDTQVLLKAAEETKFIVTMEEHSIIGGLGAAVSQYLAKEKPTKVLSIGIQDVFGESGKAEELIKKYGLDAEHLEAFIDREWSLCCI